MLNKIIAFDLDDTLCSRPKNLEHLGPEKYNYCTPIQPTIDVLNKLYDQGNIIYIYITLLDIDNSHSSHLAPSLNNKVTSKSMM